MARGSQQPMCDYLAGQRFGKLTVLRYAGHNKDRRITWLCKCDCGNEKVILGYSIRNGHTLSCDCARGDAIKISPRYKAAMKLRLLPPGEAAFNTLFARYRTGAIMRGLEWATWVERFVAFQNDLNRRARLAS